MCQTPRLGTVLGFAVTWSVAVLGAGCGERHVAGEAPPPAAMTDTDPGMAGTVFGPKMGGPIDLTGSERKLVLGTATAVQRNGVLHLFMVPSQPTTSADFAEAYLSVWLPGGEWQPMEITERSAGAAGKIRFRTLDGRSFRLDFGGGAAATGNMALAISRVGLSADGSHYYLTGTLTAALKSDQPGTPDAAIRFSINAP